VPPAKRSCESAVEDQDNVALVTIVGKSNQTAGKIGQFEVRGRRIDFYWLRHDFFYLAYFLYQLRKKPVCRTNEAFIEQLERLLDRPLNPKKPGPKVID
jgi:hypothetical protein